MKTPAELLARANGYKLRRAYNGLGWKWQIDNQWGGMTYCCECYPTQAEAFKACCKTNELQIEAKSCA